MALYAIKRPDGTLVAADPSSVKRQAWTNALVAEATVDPMGWIERRVAGDWPSRCWRANGETFVPEGRNAAAEIGEPMGYSCVEVEIVEKKGE